MRRIALLLCLWAGLTGAAHAQAVGPITTLDGDMAELRNQTTALARLMVGKRLTEPTHLHDLANILTNLAVIMNTVATHAEHDQITLAQRQALQASIDRTRLMLEQLNAQIGVVAPPP